MRGVDLDDIFDVCAKRPQGSASSYEWVPVLGEAKASGVTEPICHMQSGCHRELCGVLDIAGTRPSGLFCTSNFEISIATLCLLFSQSLKLHEYLEVYSMAI